MGVSGVRVKGNAWEGRVTAVTWSNKGTIGVQQRPGAQSTTKPTWNQSNQGAHNTSHTTTPPITINGGKGVGGRAQNTGRSTPAHCHHTWEQVGSGKPGARAWAGRQAGWGHWGRLVGAGGRQAGWGRGQGGGQGEPNRLQWVSVKCTKVNANGLGEGQVRGGRKVATNNQTPTPPPPKGGGEVAGRLTPQKLLKQSKKARQARQGG